MSNCDEYKEGRIKDISTIKMTSYWIVHNDLSKEVTMHWITKDGTLNPYKLTSGVGSTMKFGFGSRKVNEPVLIKNMDGKCYGVLWTKPGEVKMSSATFVDFEKRTRDSNAELGIDMDMKRRNSSDSDSTPVNVGKVADAYMRKDKKSEDKNWIILIVIVVIFIMFGFFGMFFIMMRSNNQIRYRQY